MAWKNPLLAIVIKPVDGAGSAGVIQCHSLSDIEKAFSTIKQLSKTVDVRSSPGCIFLVHDSKEQLLEDYAFIRQLESRLYLSEKHS